MKVNINVSTAIELVRAIDAIQNTRDIKDALNAKELLDMRATLVDLIRTHRDTEKVPSR